MTKKNYRYNVICKNCGKFISRKNEYEHKTLFCFKCESRVELDKFLCGICGKYLPYDKFGRDKSKKYGIRYNCNDCRKKKGWGNKNNGNKNNQEIKL